MKTGLSKIEKTELVRKVMAMSDEELTVVASAIPSKYMFDELQSRDARKDEMVEKILNSISEVS